MSMFLAHLGQGWHAFLESGTLVFAAICGLLLLALCVRQDKGEDKR